MKRFWQAALFALAVVVAGGAQAQNWPVKPVRWIIPFPAGGQLDVVSRLVADRLSVVLGQPIVVEPKPGADGNIGTEQVAKAAPDGYTWLAASPPTTIQPSVRPTTLRYDPLRDFEPVALIGTSPFLFVVPASLPVGNLQEFVAYAKARPGELSYAGSARGTVVHLATELFMHDAGIKMEMISYPGPAVRYRRPDYRTRAFHDARTDPRRAAFKAGKLKALAVLDSRRHPHLPDVPTVVEMNRPELVMSPGSGSRCRRKRRRRSSTASTPRS